MFKIKPFFIKFVATIVILLLVLSLANLLALITHIRPQTVLTYSIVGVFVAYMASDFFDRVIQQKDDPLPEYILDETRLTRDELYVIKSILSERLDISPEEIQVRARVQGRMDDAGKDKAGCNRPEA